MFVWLAGLALAADPADDWQKQEVAHLQNVRQVTSDFVRAGEGYFSPDGKQIIFQAEEKGTGNPFYQIFVLDLATGRPSPRQPRRRQDDLRLLPPDGKKIIFASTHLDPDAQGSTPPSTSSARRTQKAGRRRRYVWDFDPHMDIFEANPDGGGPQAPDRRARATTPRGPTRRTASTSSSARSADRRPANCTIMDADGKNAAQADERAGLLQRRAVLLARRQAGHLPQRPQEEGPPAALRHQRRRQRRAGADRRPTWVYWGPFWHQDGKHIIYAGRRPRAPAAGRTTTCTGWTSTRARRCG